MAARHHSGRTALSAVAPREQQQSCRTSQRIVMHERRHKFSMTPQQIWLTSRGAADKLNRMLTLISTTAAIAIAHMWRNRAITNGAVGVFMR